MKINRHKVALVAHDNLKPALLRWAFENKSILKSCDLFATGTTGQQISEHTGLEVSCFRSGPYGGDQQIGARISEGLLDILIFFWDPMNSMPHDADVRALLRIATLMNIPLANNPSTADCILSMLQMKKRDASARILSLVKAEDEPPLFVYQQEETIALPVLYQELK